MTPGLPLYPTRRVRDEAKRSLDDIFPSGRRMRSAINMIFRLFNPFSTLHSWAYYIKKYSYDLYLLLWHTILYFVLLVLPKNKTI